MLSIIFKARWDIILNRPVEIFVLKIFKIGVSSENIIDNLLIIQNKFRICKELLG